MALVSCPECKREVSERANSCPSCGCPIGGGSITDRNVVFERRIDEYKRNGYKLTKRQGDTVKLYKTRYFALWITLICFFMVIGLIIILFTSYIGGMAFNIFFGIILNVSMRIDGTVNISITRTGKIEETGNVLKNNLKW